MGNEIDEFLIIFKFYSDFKYTPPKMTVYAIIVTYNGAKWIDKCFGSLMESVVPLKILAIDNNSSDGTTNIIRQRFPGVEIIEMGENLGFGKANNIGLKRVLEENADFAFLLNQDAWIEKNTVETLVSTAKNYPDYGILSPVHLNGSGTALDDNFAKYLNVSSTPLIISDIYLNRLQEVYTTQYVNAAAWLLSAECLKVVGGFDPIFPHYGEDDDYLNRAMYHGFKIGIVPHVRIYHDRIIKPWEVQKLEVQRLVILNILTLKKYPAPFRSNLLLFLKTQFDKLTSLLIYRNFGDFRCSAIALWKTMANINEIRRSKKKFSQKSNTWE